MKKMRHSLFTTSTLILLMLLLVTACSSDTGNKGGGKAPASLKMLESGGLSGDSIEAAYIKPFTEKTGIKVERESPASLGKLEAMVKSGQATYDLITFSGTAQLEQAISKGLLEPFNWDAINPDPIFEDSKHPYGIGFQYVTTMMIWDTKAKPLQSWADFFDVTNFPGKRALQDDPNGALVVALLADGVDPDNLYPLDLDRAFNKLKEIAPNISVWWQTGAQPVQLITDGEVTYSNAWSGRVIDNDKLSYTYNQGLLDIGYISVPKGAASKGDKHIEAINQFIHEVTVSKNVAEAAKIIPYTGPSIDLASHFSEEELKKFPTSEENYSKQVMTNSAYFKENQEKIDQMWQEFKLSIQ